MSARSLALVAWTRNPGRLEDIGRVFGVQPKTIGFPQLRPKWLAPLRYILSTLITIVWLLRTRPQVVIVSSPPPFAAALVAIYARICNAVFILDAHPGAFGHRERIWKIMVPLQRALVRRARITLVTEPLLGSVVSDWGGDSLVFHEVPPPLQATRPHVPIGVRPRVVFTTIFDSDEPLDVIVTAACELRECDVLITGDDSRLAHERRDQLRAEAHIKLTGWLDQIQYLKLIASADIIVSLTIDPYSVMRSAFEAVYLDRVTVLSDTDTLRSYFSPSLFVENSSAAVIEGVRKAIADYESWVDEIHIRRQLLLQRWNGQRSALELAVSGVGKP